MQFFNISQPGTYHIVANGASGGVFSGEENICLGAAISANVTLSRLDMLAIIVGGEGGYSQSGSQGSGGGGGTLLFLESYSTSTPIVTAGERKLA